MSTALETTADPALVELAGAVAEDLRGLARLHDRECDQDLVAALRRADFPEGLGLRLTDERGRQAAQLMGTALAELPDPVDQPTLDALSVDFAEIYLTHGARSSPYESVWIDEGGLERQEPMFQVRAYYRRHGLVATDWGCRADDHLVLQLSFLGHLFDGIGRREDLDQAADFMDEHLLRWIGDFAHRVAGRCSTGFYGGLALLTAAYLEALRALVADVLGKSRPTADEIAKRLRSQPAAAPAAPAAPGRYVPGAGPGW